MQSFFPCYGLVNSLLFLGKLYIRESTKLKTAVFLKKTTKGSNNKKLAVNSMIAGNYPKND